MRPGNWWNIQNVAEGNRWRTITLFLKDVYNILNGGIIFQDNVRGSLVSGVEFTAANTDVPIKHGLSYVPQNYLVFNRSAAMVIYSGNGDFDGTNIYLKSSAVGVCDIFIF